VTVEELARLCEEHLEQLQAEIEAYDERAAIREAEIEAKMQRQRSLRVSTGGLVGAIVLVDLATDLTDFNPLNPVKSVANYQFNLKPN
jgi:hypothetical protein